MRHPPALAGFELTFHLDTEHVVLSRAARSSSRTRHIICAQHCLDLFVIDLMKYGQPDEVYIVSCFSLVLSLQNDPSTQGSSSWPQIVGVMLALLVFTV